MRLLRRMKRGEFAESRMYSVCLTLPSANHVLAQSAAPPYGQTHACTCRMILGHYVDFVSQEFAEKCASTFSNWKGVTTHHNCVLLWACINGNLNLVLGMKAGVPKDWRFNA
jgi:hypothetical protein